MQIKKIITRKVRHKNGNINEYTYKFIKQCNDDLFLYEEVNTHFKECFSKFDLGLIRQIIEPPKSNINTERVKIKEGTNDKTRTRRSVLHR